ncbi:hypothetical protein PTTG_26999 [Puccinia triticina 1-1 BBBD Race 1]|uniref:Uncharacterized protein n=1 Tax=Puccinia triticina (isolate 1-1 / race 1 (BBBD)) TaxID=630390 RepID=A0A180GNV3_PUCT1|nr:hypothetical protein PTTG_26999 [Puccinia triticina 1-1 BBBD Race 1]WAR60960.1 hypothetical protein PtB15_13B211 [Puccinia triticina]
MVESPGSPSSSRLEHQRLYWHYGDLVTYGFKSLRSKYQTKTAELTDKTYIEHTLSDQITSLSLALDLFGLQNEPKTKLIRVLQIQAELDYSLDQIMHLIVILCPEPTSLPNRSNDHYLKAFKTYRLERLKMNFEERLTRRMCDLFEAADELIEQMELSSAPPCISSWGISSHAKRLQGFVGQVSDAIKMMTDCFRASELAIVQHFWRSDRLSIESHLQSLIENLNTPTDSTTVEDQSPRPAKFAGEPLIQLARLAIPIFKLSRIFFAKLSKRGLAQERLPISTEISSDQIDTLARSASHVAKDVYKILTHLQLVNRGNMDVTHEAFNTIAQSLKARFESVLFLNVPKIVEGNP